MAGTPKPRSVIVYADGKGKEPFTDWLYALRDTVGRRRILARVARMEQDNFGDCKPVGDGLRELRLFFGPGYRVYFGEHAGKIIVILCGGDKDTQDRDIQLAKAYWKEYLKYEKIQKNERRRGRLSPRSSQRDR